jgi:hypothetical protein
LHVHAGECRAKSGVENAGIGHRAGSLLPSRGLSALNKCTWACCKYGRKTGAAASKAARASIMGQVLA